MLHDLISLFASIIFNQNILLCVALLLANEQNKREQVTGYSVVDSMF
jgi:hypothetical protein